MPESINYEEMKRKVVDGLEYFRPPFIHCNMAILGKIMDVIIREQLKIIFILNLCKLFIKI